MNTQPDFLSKKKNYSKNYDDRDRSRDRDRDRDQFRDKERNPRERLHDTLQYNYRKPQPYQLRDYQNEDIYSYSQRRDYKRKEQHYIDAKDSKDLHKKSYADLDQRTRRSIQPSNLGKRDDENDHDNGNDELKEKRLYSYILLPRNYYKYITKNFRLLCDELQDRIHDISDIQYDYSVPHFHEYVFRYSTETIASRALAIRIISEYLFNEMRDNFQNMTYLKVSILIPDHVIGFIIGIEGKNINRIRDETGAKIEVFQKNSSKKYRQIELSGSPRSIARASEKIYSIALKYINFNHDTIQSHSRSSSPLESSKRHSNRVPHVHFRAHEHPHPSTRSYKRNFINDYHAKGRDNDNYDKDDHYNYIDQQEQKSNSIIDLNNKKEEGEADISSQPKIFQSQTMKDYIPHHSHSRSRSRSHSSFHSIQNPSNSKMIDQPNISPQSNNQSLTQAQIQPQPQSLPQNQNQKPSSNPSLIQNEDLTQAQAQSQIPQQSEISSSPRSSLLSSKDLTKLLKKTTDQQGETSKEKCSLEVIFSSTSMNLLKQCKSNIWIDLENNYHCTVSKRTQKSSNDDISIITFIGTPEENTLALYQLQKYLIDSSYSSKSTN